MTRRLILSASFVVLAIAAGGACRAKSEEARIREMLDDAVEAIEEGRVGDAFDHVADDYADESGSDKDTVKGYLTGQAIRGSRITVVRRDQTVAIEDDTATITFDAALFRGDRKKLKGVVPERSGTYRFTLEARKEADGTWLLTSSKYEPISAASFVVNSL